VRTALITLIIEAVRTSETSHRGWRFVETDCRIYANSLTCTNRLTSSDCSEYETTVDIVVTRYWLERELTTSCGISGEQILLFGETEGLLFRWIKFTAQGGDFPLSCHYFFWLITLNKISNTKSQVCFTGFHSQTLCAAIVSYAHYTRSCHPIRRSKCKQAIIFRLFVFNLSLPSSILLI